MPVKRRIGKARHPRLSAVEEAILNDREPPAGPGINRFEAFMLRAPDGAKLGELWQQHGEAVTARWAVEHPGTRPSCWWKFSAPRLPAGTHPGVYFDGKLPELRRRLGGIGTPASEVLAYVPDSAFGIPRRWVSRFDVKYFGTGFRGVAIDPFNPPRYEAQAAYLERHGLLLPGELARLRDVDFQPEFVLPPWAVH